MRLLIMFGPMILRQFQKMQRNKARQQPTQYPDRQLPRSNRDRNFDRGASQSRTRDDRGDYVEYKDLNAELGRPTPEEKAMKLKEEEIMLDKEDLRHFDKQAPIADATSGTIEEQIEELKGDIKDKTPKDDDLDLKDLFLDSDS